jgi:uncharacterized protein (DUF736 family)
METSMTATIEPAQGHGLTDRRLHACSRVNEDKDVTWDTMAFNFGSPRAGCCAWKKTARETEREYRSVKLDDPSFRARSTPRW